MCPVNYSADDGSGGFAAVDVCYPPSGGARAAIVVTRDTSYADLLVEWTTYLPQVLPYRPGQFFLRELPPLRAILSDAGQLSLLIIDGYVDLDPDSRPGLGSYVYGEFAVPVVGVAKSAFHTATHAVPVMRGGSGRPLFITATGIPTPQAASLVRNMASKSAFPTHYDGWTIWLAESSYRPSNRLLGEPVTITVT